MNAKIVGYRKATEITGLPEGTLYSLVSQKRIPHIRLGKRLVRFNVEELQAWLEAQAVPVSAPLSRARKGGSR